MSVTAFTPYRWNPVIRPGEDLRVTFAVRGQLDDIDATIAGVVYPGTLSDGGAQVVVAAADAETIPDRAPAVLRVNTGGVWTVLAHGHVTREDRYD